MYGMNARAHQFTAKGAPNLPATPDLAARRIVLIALVPLMISAISTHLTVISWLPLLVAGGVGVFLQHRHPDRAIRIESPIPEPSRLAILTTN